jgi:hypothetical protein
LNKEKGISMNMSRLSQELEVYNKKVNRANISFRNSGILQNLNRGKRAPPSGGKPRDEE